MHGVPLQFEHPQDVAQFRRPAHRAGIELYRAHIVRHAFEPHTHEAFGLGAIESGVERFRYRGSEHLAPPDSLVLMNPDVLHTGRAETDGGWRYRMAYIDAGRGRDRDRRTRLVVRRRRRPRSGARARRVTRCSMRCGRRTNRSRSTACCSRCCEAFRRQARARRWPLQAQRRASAASSTTCATTSAQRMTLEELAAVAGLSPFHFLRSFRARSTTPRRSRC